MRFFRRALNNQSGSVLLTVVLVMLILSIIAVGTIQASLNNVAQAKKADNHERLFYGAESAANSAAETLRKQVAAYYQEMAAAALTDILNGATSIEHCINYYALKSVFATAVAANSRAAYSEPDLTSYERGSISTSTVFGDGVVISALGVTPPTLRFTISSAATDAGESRVFQTSVDITLEDVDIIRDISRPPDLAVGLAVGGTLVNNALFTSIDVNGDASIGGEDIGWASDFECDNGDYIDPNIIDSIDWRLDFGAMLNAAQTNAAISVDSRSLRARPTEAASSGFDNRYGTVTLSSNYASIVIRGRDTNNNNMSVVNSSSSNIRLDTAIISNIQNLAIGRTSGSRYLTIRGGTIWTNGDLTINSRTTLNATSAANPVYLWSGGNTTINTGFSQACLYANGNITAGSLNINQPPAGVSYYCYAGGSLTMNNSGNNMTNTVFRSSGSATLNGTYSNCVIYSDSSLSLNGTFSNCDIYSGSGATLLGNYTDCTINGNSSVTMGSGTAGPDCTFTRCLVYSQNNLTIRNRTNLYDCDLYCRGSLSYETDWNTDLVDWAYARDCFIVAGGNASIGQDTDNTIMLVQGNMDLRGVECSNALYYANGNMACSGIFKDNTTNGVFYCNGDASMNNWFNDLRLTGGQIICRGNLTANGPFASHRLTYNGAICDALLNEDTLYNVLGIIPSISGPPIAVFPLAGEVYISEVTIEAS